METQVNYSLTHPKETPVSLRINTPSRHIVALPLPLAIASLFTVPASGDEYGAEVTAREIAKTTVTADGQPVDYPRTEKPEVTASVVKLPPEAETGWHYHPIPVYGYVIRGTLEVERENGQVDTYHEGEAIIEAVDSPHNARNTGTEPVELVTFYGSARLRPSPTSRGAGRR